MSNHQESEESPGETRVEERDEKLTTGDMARLSDSTLRTVRFYEEAGLLSPVQRTAGGHRLFAHTDLRKLRLVAQLRQAGFSIDEIRALLETKTRSDCGAEASRDLIHRIDSQIAELTRRLDLMKELRADLDHARRVLRSCIACRNNSLFPDECDQCHVMQANEDMPDVMSVLWRVDR